MVADTKQLARILVESVEGKTKQQMSEEVKDFVRFLAEQNLIDQWREIEQAIDAVWKEEYGVSSVRLVTAHELTDKAKQALQSVVKGADLDQRVDKELIGGAVLRIDDTRIDGSVSAALQKMKISLSK